MTPSALMNRVRELAVPGSPMFAGVRLLVLHGSRARGTEYASSDWDLGVLTDGNADLATLAADLVAILGTDRVDLVDLDQASALLRYRAARDGVVLLDRDDEFRHFQFEAVRFWCDAGPVIRCAQADVLAALG